MAWTTPKTWVAGNTLTAAELNEQVRDNLDFLFSKPISVSNLDEAANYTTTSTTFVDVDATDLGRTITTSGGDVLVWCSNIYMKATARVGVFFNIDVNGSLVAAHDGIAKATFVDAIALDSLGTGNYAVLSFAFVVENVASGSNTFKLQWKQSNATQTVTWYVGAGTTDADIHPQFGVKEL